MKSFIAAVIFAAVIAISSAKPRIEDDYFFLGLNHGKIVGGVEATPYEYPWLVDMRQGGGHYCGGSIVSPEWVVTAAHCATGSPSAYTLTAGDHDISVTEGTEQVRNVVKIIRHPFYQAPGVILRENDIALMQVSPPFEFNQYVSAAIVPELGYEPTQIAWVTGWGALSSGGGSPTKLMKVDVPYVNDANCNVSYTGGIAESMICYGIVGKDSCQGDSGGPIMCGPNNALCGIVSWGRGCAEAGYPGVYTETSYFAEWIRSATIPTQEDESPQVIVLECGGSSVIEASSARISLVFPPGGNLRCTWAIKAKYDSVRFNLRHGLTDVKDGLFVTEFDATSLRPKNESTKIDTVGQNYTLSGHSLLLVTVTLEFNSPSTEFTLDIFSSGFGSAMKNLSEFTHFKDGAGSYKHPVGGFLYNNNENALFIVNPTQLSYNWRLTFSYVDIEEGGVACLYDAVEVYSWQDTHFQLASRFCGTIEPMFGLTNNFALVTFKTDGTNVERGFTFTW